MDEIKNQNKPKGYVLALSDCNQKGAIISGFRTYNESNSIVYDLKAFLAHRFSNNPDKNLIQFRGTKNELLNDKVLNAKFKNINEKIQELKETNYLLIIGDI